MIAHVPDDDSTHRRQCNAVCTRRRARCERELCRRAPAVRKGGRAITRYCPHEASRGNGSDAIITAVDDDEVASCGDDKVVWRLDFRGSSGTIGKAADAARQSRNDSAL